MLAIGRPSHAFVDNAPPHVGAKPSLQKALVAIDGLRAALDVMLVKLKASDAPGYLQCVSISATSHTLAASLRNAASLAAAAQAEATTAEARQILVLCRSQMATRSMHVDARLRALRPHFARMGVLPFVRRDLRAGFEAALLFLGAALKEVPDELRSDAQDLVAEVLDSTTTMLSEYDVQM